MALSIRVIIGRPNGKKIIWASYYGKKLLGWEKNPWKGCMNSVYMENKEFGIMRQKKKDAISRYGKGYNLFVLHNSSNVYDF